MEILISNHLTVQIILIELWPSLFKINLVTNGKCVIIHSKKFKTHKSRVFFRNTFQVKDIKQKLFIPLNGRINPQ